MDILEFQNPVFINASRQSPQLTVRRGTKWDGKKGEVWIPINGNEVRCANIIDTVVMRCCDIPAIALVDEHDPICRDYTGLVSTLKTVYRGFKEEEIVTLVYFTMM
jgi:hypothetical protein